MNKFYIGCDLGSSQCKTGLFNEDGSTVALLSQEYASHYPHEGWVEQNPEDWVQACFASIARILKQTGVGPANIAGVGIVGVTHNMVLLDDNNKPLAPTILIYDTRSKSQVARLCATWGADYIRERTLNDITTVWSWPQLLWVKEHQPEIWNRIATIVFQKDYVRSRLSGSFCTDTIDAEGSLLFDPVADSWIEEFYQDLGLTLDQLPKVVDPMTVVGGVSREAALLTGLREGTPVIAGTTDTVAEVLAAGGVESGIATLKLASVGRITLTQSSAIQEPHILNYKHILKGLWYPGTASKSAAYAFRWLKDLLYPESTNSDVYQKMDELAAQIPAGSQGLLFHPHLMGEWAPHWNTAMKANFIGLQARHTSGNLIRAVLEGVAFSLLDAFGELALPPNAIRQLLLIGQGSRSPLWSQIIADVFNHAIMVPSQMEAVSGAGIITIMGITGKPISDFYPLIRKGTIYTPHDESVQRYARLFEIYKEADVALTSVYEKLSKVQENTR